MLKTLWGVIAGVATVALLTGCGRGDTGKTAGSDDGEAPASKTTSPRTGADGATHKVTLQVTGTGTATGVMYHAASSGYGNQKLPWTKTETIKLTEAEQKIGYLVSVVPGSVLTSDGTLKAAACVIKVDGKQVADNDGGKSPEPCEYKVK
ncbi:hypothetical protein [Streptomyces sp. NPDC001410]|uniref:hypothetical protein n=1 Tax=Streptomyces sp. NPDC001410 TaxID=3364574 RepID=UPI00367BC354